MRSLLLAALALVLGCAGASTREGAHRSGAPQAGPPPQPSPAPAENAVATGFAELGIEKTMLRPTAMNSMLDFRFRVLDAEKAAILLRRSVADFVLVDQKTGQALPVPVSSRVGPLRQTTMEPEVGRIYGTFFHNPGGMVRPGDRVTIRLVDKKTKEFIAEVKDVPVD